MEGTQNLYTPVVSFKKQRSEMQINNTEHNKLYEKAYLSKEDVCQTEYAQNTTTWD